MDYLYDYHIHSTHSSDGHNNIFDICNEAVKKGLREIAVTDHFEPTPGNADYSSYNPYAYWIELALANEVFKDKLKVKLGIELGQPHHFLDSSNAIIKKIPYDYVIGSAHKLQSGVDFSEIAYEDFELSDIAQIYLNELTELVTKADFDCVGHMDLIKRYCKSFYSEKVTLDVQHELLTQTLKLIIENGKSIEINTSGLRQSTLETMPGFDVLKLYRELGGEILTIGSDAHFASDVGAGISNAIELARFADFKYLTVFEKRKPQWINISRNEGFYFFENSEISICS